MPRDVSRYSRRETGSGGFRTFHIRNVQRGRPLRVPHQSAARRFGKYFGRISAHTVPMADMHDVGGKRAMVRDEEGGQRGTASLPKA